MSREAAMLAVADFLAEMTQEVEGLLERRLPELSWEYRDNGADADAMIDAQAAVRGALIQCRDAIADECVKVGLEASTLQS